MEFINARSVPIALIWTALALAASAQKTPQFEKYPVTETFTGTPAAPILATPEQRRYRTRIRDGVSPGTGKHIGPNFSGHYFVIRWGCGSQCVMMATVDAKTGIVYDPPLSGTGSELYLPLDNLSDAEVDFRPNSSLLILRNACRDFKNRDSCGTYYFNWKDHQFALLKFVMVNPLR